MKKYLVILTIFIMSIMFGGMVMASSSDTQSSQDTITFTMKDIADMDQTTRNHILSAMKDKKDDDLRLKDILQNASKNSNGLKEWAGVISDTIKTVCHDLGVEVNEFVKTPVGMIVTGLIIYKVIGKDVITSARRIFFVLIGWPIGMFIIGLSFFMFHVPKKIVTKSKDENDNIIKNIENDITSITAMQN